MKIEKMVTTNVANFENRLFYAQLSSPYDCYSDSKYGYLAGAEEVLDSNKSIDELEAYIKEYEVKNGPFDEYEKAYILAYKDFIKQEKLKLEVTTNE